MHAEERQQEILRRARADGLVDVMNLADDFAVTSETVRRDLTALEHGQVAADGLARDREVVREVHDIDETIGSGPPKDLLLPLLRMHCVWFHHRSLRTSSSRSRYAPVNS